LRKREDCRWRLAARIVNHRSQARDADALVDCVLAAAPVRRAV